MQKLYIRPASVRLFREADSVRIKIAQAIFQDIQKKLESNMQANRRNRPTKDDIDQAIAELSGQPGYANVGPEQWNNIKQQVHTFYRVPQGVSGETPGKGYDAYQNIGQTPEPGFKPSTTVEAPQIPNAAPAAPAATEPAATETAPEGAPQEQTKDQNASEKIPFSDEARQLSSQLFQSISNVTQQLQNFELPIVQMIEQNKDAIRDIASGRYTINRGSHDKYVQMLQQTLQMVTNLAATEPEDMKQLQSIQQGMTRLFDLIGQASQGSQQQQAAPAAQEQGQQPGVWQKAKDWMRGMMPGGGQAQQPGPAGATASTKSTRKVITAANSCAARFVSAEKLKMYEGKPEK